MEKTLLSLKEGERAAIKRLDGGTTFQRKLRMLGIREGKTISIVTKQLFNGPLVVEVDDRDTTMGRGMAGKIIVEV